MVLLGIVLPGNEHWKKLGGGKPIIGVTDSVWFWVECACAADVMLSKQVLFARITVCGRCCCGKILGGLELDDEVTVVFSKSP